MKPPSSPSDPSSGVLFGGVLARGPVNEQVGDEAWLRALLDAEAALAVASAACGLLPTDTAAEIAAACAETSGFDIGALGRAAGASGTPVVPLVRAIQERVPRSAAGEVHRGATSQDIIDTAMMLVAKRAIRALVVDVRGCADAAANLTDIHRDTVMAGRTLMQQGVPTTFGLKAAGWTSGLDGAGARLSAVSGSLPAQLGGAVGTLAAFDTDAPLDLAERFAGELGLAVPHLAWHSDRLPVADLAGALGAAAGALGKVALDVVLLAQTEVAEVREGVEGRGGSSTMTHKHNPIAAISARAATLRAPGLVATLLAAMQQEHERAAGAWQAEWETLSQLLRSTGSAAAWLLDCLEHLQVDPARMRANLGAAGVSSMLDPDQHLGAAGALVDRFLASRSEPPA
jgi:3-carboxy-cis,cis-muconate cycloisomerase